MDTEEKQMLNMIIERINQLEQEIKVKQIEKSEILGNPEINEIPKKKEKNSIKLFSEIILRAVVIALIAFAIGNIYLKYFDNKEENKTNNQSEHLLIKNDTSIEKLKSSPNHNKINIIKKSLDSLNNLFIKEVSGIGSSKQAGYGPNAISIKLKMDSLKNELND